MKSRIFLVLLFMGVTYNNIFCQCGGGELYFRIKPWNANSPYSFDLTITMNGYGWLWNSGTGKPVLVTSFNKTSQNIKCTSYSAPKTSTSPNRNIPWGVFTVNMS